MSIIGLVLSLGAALSASVPGGASVEDKIGVSIVSKIA
jgi:hypothetical protein